MPELAKMCGTRGLDYRGRGLERSIERCAEALWSGTFVNRARVDARSIDGPAIQPVYADAAVAVGEFEGEREAPGWGFSLISGENDELAL